MTNEEILIRYILADKQDVVAGLLAMVERVKREAYNRGRSDAKEEQRQVANIVKMED